MLLHMIGPAALEVYNTFTWENNDDKQKVDMIVAKFEGHCILNANVTWERHVFNTRNQGDDETIDQYITDRKKKAQTCEFQDLKNGLIWDRVVCGICLSFNTTEISTFKHFTTIFIGKFYCYYLLAFIS